MCLITKTIREEFEKHPLGSQEERGEDAVILCKIFNPFGAGTWLITEAEQQEDGTWLCFGWAEIGYEWEAGYISFQELEDCRIQVGGRRLPLERDLHLKIGTTIKEYLGKEAVA